jgi:hypothetical protein
MADESDDLPDGEQPSTEKPARSAAFVWAKRIALFLVGAGLLFVGILVASVFWARKKGGGTGTPTATVTLKELEALHLQQGLLSADLEPMLVRHDQEGSASDDYTALIGFLLQHPEDQQAASEVLRTNWDAKGQPIVRQGLARLSADHVLGQLMIAVGRKDQLIKEPLISYNDLLDRKAMVMITNIAVTFPGVLLKAGQMAQADGNTKLAEMYYRASYSCAYYLTRQPHLLAQEMGAAVFPAPFTAFGEIIKATGDVETPKKMAAALEASANVDTFRKLEAGVLAASKNPETFDTLRVWLRDPVFDDFLSYWTAASVMVGWTDGEIKEGRASPARRQFLAEMAASQRPLVKFMGSSALSELAALEGELKTAKPEERLGAFKKLQRTLPDALNL